MRLKSAIWVSAYLRRCQSEGAFATLRRRGAEEAGAIFVLVDRRDGRFDLYGPAPQSVFDDERPSDRLFSRLAEGATEEAARGRMEQETRFDPDLWLIDIEDREGRSFLELVAEVPRESGHRFTTR